MPKRSLVIAAHPDDAALGCGGTIARFVSEGKEVYACIVTRVYTPDWSEEYLTNCEQQTAESNKVLGISKAYRLNFPAVKLDMVPQKQLNDALFQVISEVKPEVVLIPHAGDLNRDHRLVFEASLVATRPGAGYVKSILAYESVSSTEWGHMFTPFVPDVYVDVGRFLDVKLAAVAAYADEIRPFPHPRSIEVIKALARKRGSEIGANLAEAFMLVRHLV